MDSTPKMRRIFVCIVSLLLRSVTTFAETGEIQGFATEALFAWRAKARCNVVPAERLRDLFEELHFCPTDKQINEMLQTAKLFARRGSSLEPNASGSSKRVNGLTFGEFCVLAADLKRFRTTNGVKTIDEDATKASAAPTSRTTSNNDPARPGSSSANGSRLGLTKILQAGADPEVPRATTTTTNASDCDEDAPELPEVFLGGSCNPTTWRADVAIPALDKFGITFYNPQVSDWTPDLIELEHRAKEKARVLFFVMDSETRASAGAIEAAHIAGQNTRHLVLVLHPYQRDQSILNEPLSAQEYVDLKRNQELLRELVVRRGLPVLDNIRSGLQRTQQILAGTSERQTPFNIASRLISVRRAFDVVSDKSLNGKISIAQCRQALPVLGYAQHLLSCDNLKSIILNHREALRLTTSEENESDTANRVAKQTTGSEVATISVSFDEFCILTSYLTVLQQEIHESGCVSPIKGTNLPPPPIFLTNTPEWSHSQPPTKNCITNVYNSQIFRTNSCQSVPEDKRPGADIYHRDSGTSSPQPNEQPTPIRPVSQPAPIVISDPTETHSYRQSSADQLDYESDSNDSVFSSGSSSDSNPEAKLRIRRRKGLELRDVYLGGSCMLRTKWRPDFAIPFLKQREISFHLPTLHESISAMATDAQFPFPVANAMLSEEGAELRRKNGDTEGRPMFDPEVMDASRVLLFVITNDTRSLAPMTLAAHYIGLGYNVVLCVQMLPTDFCIIGSDKLTPLAIKDYNRGRSYLIDLAKRQGVPVFTDLRQSLECAAEKVKTYNSRKSI